MLKPWKPFLGLFMFLVLYVNPLFAAESDVVINELMPNPSSGKDWIELYNLSKESTDISGWILKDSTGEIYSIQEATVSGQGFISFEVGSRLNKNEDAVYLLNNEEEINSCEYNKYYGDNVSIGRYPDGYGDCVVLNSVSRDKNNSPAVPTSTPTPSSTPVPTKAPTPTPTLTPTKSSTPEPAATNTSVPTPSPTITGLQAPINKSSIGRAVNLFLPTFSPASSAVQTEDVLGKATSEAEAFEMNLGGIFMSLGGIFIVGAGVLLVKSDRLLS